VAPVSGLWRHRSQKDILGKFCARNLNGAHVFSHLLCYYFEPPYVADYVGDVLLFIGPWNGINLWWVLKVEKAGKKDQDARYVWVSGPAQNFFVSVMHCFHLICKI
jgi:hypothetical protein